MPRQKKKPVTVSDHAAFVVLNSAGKILDEDDDLISLMPRLRKHRPARLIRCVDSILLAFTGATQDHGKTHVDDNDVVDV